MSAVCTGDGGNTDNSTPFAKNTCEGERAINERLHFENEKLREQITALRADTVDTEESVQITAADYNGDTWDGSPFSALPEWLRDAIEQELVTVEPSNTDYAMWRVVTVIGPGDRIVRSSLPLVNK